MECSKAAKAERMAYRKQRAPAGGQGLRGTVLGHRTAALQLCQDISAGSVVLTTPLPPTPCATAPPGEAHPPVTIFYE